MGCSGFGNQNAGKSKISNFMKESSANYENVTTVKWINRYTRGYMSKKGRNFLWPIIRGIITSPDYSMKDFKAIIKNGYAKNRSLTNELIAIDLSETLEAISVPYLILQGDTDIVTSTKMISNFVETVNNSNLHYQLVDNSGHIPSSRGMEAIINTGFGFFT